MTSFDSSSFDVLVAVSVADGTAWVEKNLLYKGRLALITVAEGWGSAEGRVVHMIHVTDAAYKQTGVTKMLEVLLRNARRASERFMEAPVADLALVQEPDPQYGAPQAGDVVRLARATDSWGPSLKVGALGKVIEVVDSTRIRVDLDGLSEHGPLVFWADRFVVVERPPRLRYRDRSPNLRPDRAVRPPTAFALPLHGGTESANLIANAMWSYARTREAGETLYVIVPEYTPMVTTSVPGVEFVRPGDPRLRS